MTKFEKVLGKFGLAYRSRLNHVTETKDAAVEVSGSLRRECNEAIGRLSFVAAENQRLLAENADLRAEVAGHVRVIGALMDEVAERVPA